MRKPSLRREAAQVSETGSHQLFYKIFLPVGVVANLVLGILVLSDLRPDGWPGWLLVTAGAFCCMIAGWLAAAAWSKSYWNRSMARQVAVWRRIADTLFSWVEDVPVPPESLSRLKTSLEEAATGSKS